MALPKLNQTPSYELTVPSTGETLQYRPFLVKEQKILLMALESRDERQILMAVDNTLSVCVQSNHSIDQLKMFDIEYIFLQMRGKSIGESAGLTLKCADCEADNEIKIPLSSIELSIPEKLNTSLNITEEYVLNLSWPNFKAMKNIESPKEEETQSETIYKNALLCLESLDTAEEKIYFIDEPSEEKEEFMGSLTTSQFNTIIEYAGAMPQLTHDVEFKCSGCTTKNQYNLRGMQDFF